MRSQQNSAREKKAKRGRYGDGCVYRQGRIWWLTWHEPKRQPDGEIVRCYVDEVSSGPNATSVVKTRR